MNIIKTEPVSKHIQSWQGTVPPPGHAIVPDNLDTTEFYTYNGFVNLEVDEENTVTAITPNLEAWEAWKSSLPVLTASELREVAYGSWTSYQDGTPYYNVDGLDLTVDQIREQLTYYVGDSSDYGLAKYQELSTAYTLARQDIRSRLVEVEDSTEEEN